MCFSFYTGRNDCVISKTIKLYVFQTDNRNTNVYTYLTANCTLLSYRVTCLSFDCSDNIPRREGGGNVLFRDFTPLSFLLPLSSSSIHRVEHYRKNYTTIQVRSEHRGNLSKHVSSCFAEYTVFPLFAFHYFCFCKILAIRCAHSLA